MSEKAEKTAVKEPSFSKEQLIASKKYKPDRDALSILLEDGRNYTYAETDKALSDFYNSPVIERKVK